jgi:hypothetical protein
MMRQQFEELVAWQKSDAIAALRAPIVSLASIDHRIADDAARPGVEDHGKVDKADRDREPRPPA